jgi:predicted O-methyltransferase YrrM
VPRDALTWLIDSEGNAGLEYRSSRSDTTPHFRVGDVEFRCGFGHSRGRLFSIQKDPGRIEALLEIVASFQGENFVELGVAFGGSSALMALVAAPRKLVAVDLKPDRVEALDELIAERGLGERIRLHYGVDQADREQLAAIIDDELGDEPLGLVIDDASHRLDATRASFEALFPRLRPGGLFLIEDWNHQHLLSRAVAAASADPGPEPQARFERATERFLRSLPARKRGVRADAPSLTQLVIELILVHAESDEFVREVRVDRQSAHIYRGGGGLDPSEFRLADLLTNDFKLLPASHP